MHRGNAGLPFEPFAKAVGAGLGQQQRLVARQMLQPPQVRPQIGVAVQIHVERTHVEVADVEMFGRREIHVGDEGVGRNGLHVVVQIPQETLDPRMPVPAHHRGRDLVAHRHHQRGRMRRDAARSVDDGATHLSGERRIVEKRDVLRPGNARHHVQAVTGRAVQERERRHRVGAHGVQAGRGHHRKVAIDAVLWRELQAFRIGREGAVRHPTDEEATPIEFEELALHAWNRGHANRSRNEIILSPLSFQRCHFAGTDVPPCGIKEPAGGPITPA